MCPQCQRDRGRVPAVRRMAVAAMHVTIRTFSSNILARDGLRAGKHGVDAGRLRIPGHTMRSAVRLPRIGMLPPMVASAGSPGDAALA